jgi:glycosyltransferase involved in cell wall biosynthesis
MHSPNVAPSDVTAERRPRVLIIITLAEVGGAQSHVAALLPALTSEFEVVVAAHGPGPLREAARAAGARFIALRHVRRALHPWHDLLGLLEVVALVRRVRPDIVHTHSSKAGILGRLGATVAKAPVRLFTAHGWAFAAHEGWAARLYLWADRLAARVTTCVVCVSERERVEGLQARTCRDNRTAVIYNAVDVAAALPAALVGAPPRIISVGRFKAPKDPVTLIRALARLPRNSFRAMLVGDGPDRPLVAAAVRREDLDGAVELVGERGDVPALLAGADAFVLSTRSEGLPMSLLEAMAAGLPVVASAVGGVPEAVIDRETALLVPPRDPEALAQALRALLGDAELRRRLGKAGRHRAVALFGLSAFRDAHLRLYHALLERSGHTPVACRASLS